MIDILLHRIAQHSGKLILTLLGVHISKLLGIGHKANLGQHRWHIGSIQHLQQLTLNLAGITTSLGVVRLHNSSHHLTILAIGELQILNICPHHCRSILIRHIDKLVLIVVVESTLVIAGLLLALTHNDGLHTIDRGGFWCSIGVN